MTLKVGRELKTRHTSNLPRKPFGDPVHEDGDSRPKRWKVTMSILV